MIEIAIEKRLGKFDLSVNFSVNKSKCVIFGSSGSGKSSLLKMIAGFYNPDYGSIKINDRIFFSSEKKINLSIQRRNVGYLPQEYTLFPNMTIKENIEYGIKKRKLKDKMGIENLAERFNIVNCLDRYPYEISGGQKQRAALARALIVKPDILLLDEPFSALDKPIREELRELVADVAKTFSIPVLFVTHDLEEAFVFGEEIVIIKDGRVVEFGDKEAVFENPRFVDTAQLVDFGNIWKIKGFFDNYIELENGLKLTCENIDKSAKYCCIKPENVMILRKDTDISDKENKIETVIEKINFRGRYINLVAKTDDGVLIYVNIPPHILGKMSLDEGKNIIISVKKESIVFCRE